MIPNYYHQVSHSNYLMSAGATIYPNVSFFANSEKMMTKISFFQERCWRQRDLSRTPVWKFDFEDGYLCAVFFCHL